MRHSSKVNQSKQRNKVIDLGQVIDIISGAPFKSDLFNQQGVGLPLIRVRDVNTGPAGIFYSGDFSKEHIVESGDLLISMDGDFKCVRWAYGKGLLNQRVCKIIPKEKLLDKFYLEHFLPRALIEIHRETTFTTVKHLSTKTIREIQIPLPPLDDQKRIAHLLGKVEGLIVRRKQHLQQLDDLLKSVFLEMFGDPVRNEKGWKTKEITDVCDMIVDCVNKTAPQVEEQTPFIMVRTSNIRGGAISLDNIKYVDAETYRIWTRRSKPRIGDILFTREAPMGEAGLICFEEQIFLGQRIMQYRCNPAIANPKFILELMKTRFFQRQIEKLGKGSTVKHLTVPDCFKFIVIVPPLSVQNQFAAIVEKVESLKPLYQQSLTDLEHLCGSLSKKAFKGELDLSRVSLPVETTAEELNRETRKKRMRTAV